MGFLPPTGMRLKWVVRVGRNPPSVSGDIHLVGRQVSGIQSKNITEVLNDFKKFCKVDRNLLIKVFTITFGLFVPLHNISAM
jgi:hypothetical protein